MRFTFLLGVFLLNLQLVFSSTFTVKNTNDSGAGSLREAVDLSNNEKGLSKIDFLIDENPTITLQTPLSISSCVEIDGATSAGNIVIQGPQDACAISCVNVASGDSIVLKNIEIGISADKSNVGQIELHEITGESSATFICDGVKMAFELKRGAHVKTFDYAWIIKMNDTEVANSFQGVVYGKELYLSNKTYFHDCRNVLTFFSSTSTTCSNIEIKDCKFSDNTGNISVSGDVTQIRKCEFINNKSSIFLASRPKSIINIDSCIFEKSQGIAIRSSNLIDGWTVKIENNRFYDSESNNNYLVALEKRYSDNVVLSPSKLTFKNNYFGINGEGESSNVNKAFYVQMDTALIVGNTFCNVLGGPAIIDGGSDYFLVKDNYIGTDTLSRNLGNYGGIQLLSIDGSVKGSYYKQGKKENKIIKDNTFAYNENYGVLVDSMLVKAIIYNNRFIHTKNKAIIYRPEDHGKTAPSFVAKVENGQILINGLGNPGAYAEIYKSSAEKQTAIDFLKSAKIDPDGLFSISIPLSVFKDKNLCISAKQTLYDDKEEGATSELSDPTCLCYPDTIQVKDTIIVGTSFLGSKYTAGKHDSIFEYLKAKNGCDSIVMHTILVKPDPTIKEYYVKTTGKGNGTTWTDAMNGEDFALYFSLVDDDVTFHIAKGEYRPIYLNPEQSRENKKYTAYYTDKRVNLVGGYTSDPLEGEMPNPKLNATTFLGELEDNTIVYNIFVMKPQSQGTVTLQGIQLRKSAGSPNADDGMLFFEPQQKGVDILLERCTFQDASTAFRLTNSTGNISECMFSGNSGCTFIYNCSDVDINKCTFSQNSSVLSAFTDGSVSMTNSTIVGNSLINFSKINQTSNNDLQLRNNTFTGNFFGSINSVKYQLVGNIFAGNVNLVDTENVNSKYNLYLKGETAKDFLSATDIEAEAADFEYLLGDELEDHGGFTKTILLKDDQMMNGTTIRLPKSIAALSEDQRTVKRLDYTCIGSFEIPCMRDTTILEDHVYVGTSYSFSDELDGILTEVGDFEYTKKLKNVAGCDSLVKLLLTVECNDLETNINKAIKSGESYSFATLFKDRVFVKSGTYTFTDKLKSVYGCDSIVNLTLSVGCDAIEVNKESTAKVGEPFTYAGVCKDTVFTTAGEKTIKRTYTAVSGCDSVVNLTVNVECPTIEKSIKESIKSGESYSFATLFKDRVFVKSGTYTFTDKMKSVYGCDSIVNLTLSVG
ncbi:MAG: right-handed parallel beta-helix repeat-containing protein, partial [Paludibacteraceae bacterium]|nr:right-handed parallel beta-helix repeat-containing protein [Paludibacteraceae bacterium]